MDVSKRIGAVLRHLHEFINTITYVSFLTGFTRYTGLNKIFNPVNHTMFYQSDYWVVSRQVENLSFDFLKFCFQLLSLILPW